MSDTLAPESNPFWASSKLYQTHSKRAEEGVRRCMWTEKEIEWGTCTRSFRVTPLSAREQDQPLDLGAISAFSIDVHEPVRPVTPWLVEVFATALINTLTTRESIYPIQLASLADAFRALDAPLLWGELAKSFAESGVCAEFRLEDLERVKPPALLGLAIDEKALAVPQPREPVASVGVGKHQYRLRESQYLAFEGGKVELAGVVGFGASLDEALEDLGFRLHARYQELDAQGPHAWTDDEEAQWDRICELVDVEDFEARRPRTERVLGKVLSADGRSATLHIETWGKTLHVSVADLPDTAVVKLSEGQWFSAILLMRGEALSWVDFQSTSPPPSREHIGQQLFGTRECDEQ